MTWEQWLQRWNIGQLPIAHATLAQQWAPSDEDREAAWKLHLELTTRLITRPLPEHEGGEEAALTSVSRLFGITRGVLREGGPGCVGVASLAVPVLNHIVRPFTTRWHSKSLDNAFADPAQCARFREDFAPLQITMRCYSNMLAEMAGVRDLIRLEETPGHVASPVPTSID